MGKKAFMKKWEESDDSEKLNLLENNLHLKMVDCQGDNIVVRETLDKLHIKWQRV